MKRKQKGGNMSRDTRETETRPATTTCYPLFIDKSLDSGSSANAPGPATPPSPMAVTPSISDSEREKRLDPTCAPPAHRAAVVI
jgi:hypothetical protein